MSRNGEGMDQRKSGPEGPCVTHDDGSPAAQLKVDFGTGQRVKVPDAVHDGTAVEQKKPRVKESELGLSAVGIVSVRRRRVFDDKSTGEEPCCVIYTLDCSGTELKIDAWNPKEFLAVGEHVDIPVKVRTYMSKSGPRFSLQMEGSDDRPGVEF